MRRVDSEMTVSNRHTQVYLLFLYFSVLVATAVLKVLGELSSNQTACGDALSAGHCLDVSFFRFSEGLFPTLFFFSR